MNYNDIKNLILDAQRAIREIERDNPSKELDEAFTLLVSAYCRILDQQQKEN